MTLQFQTKVPTYPPGGSSGYLDFVLGIDADNMVFLYPCDDAGATLTDHGPNSIDGTVVGATANAELGPFGELLLASTDGVNDYLEASVSGTYTNLNRDEHTMVFWAKAPTYNTSNETLVNIFEAADNYHRIYAPADTQVRQNLHIDEVNMASNPKSVAGLENLWTMFTIQYSVTNGYQRIRINDGTWATDTSPTPASWAATALNTVLLGAFNTTQGYFEFTGVGYWGLWNGILSDSELNSIYNGA